MIRMFQLTNESGGLGLSCSPDGVSLAGVALLRRTQAGFAPRPASEIASLLSAAYGKDPTGLQSRLDAIAQALNRGDLALAAIVAVQTQTPELSGEAATRLLRAEEKLSKYNYNPDEPRDWHGRWTRDGSIDATGSASSGSETDRSAAEPSSDLRQRVADNALPGNAAVLSDEGSREIPGASGSLEQTFERKYDDLGPVDFAKQVIQFGYWLGRQGGSLSLAEQEQALAEYSFVQDRLSFWLGYDYKPVIAQLNLFSIL